MKSDFERIEPKRRPVMRGIIFVLSYNNEFRKGDRIMGAPSKADVGMSARQLKRWIIGINIFLSLVLASVAYSQEMWVLTEEFKPYQYIDENGNMAGFGIQLITLMFKDAGVPMKGGKIHIFPWSRTYRLLLEEKNWPHR